MFKSIKIITANQKKAQEEAQEAGIYEKAIYRTIILVIMVCMFGVVNVFATKSVQPLVSAEWLKANLKYVQVLDVRNNITEEIIPGSYHSAYKEWRSTDKANPGSVPPVAVLQENVDRLGLHPNNHYVIVFEGKNASDFGSAARVYWNLKYIGFDKLSILNGGIKAYGEENPGALWANSHAIPKLDKPYTIAFRNGLAVDREGIKAASKDASNGVLIDSRNDAQFGGEAKHPVAARFGAIKGAKQVWQGDWFVDDSAILKSEANIFAQAEKYNLPTKGVLLAYCNTGHWAASNWFVLSEILGHENVKLYPDSFVEYSKLDGIDLINEPSRLSLLWREVKSWF